MPLPLCALCIVGVSDKPGSSPSPSTQASGYCVNFNRWHCKHATPSRVPVNKVSEITDFPEILQGRVKTLHPKIHGGILARRAQDLDTLEQFSIPAIDLVVVNLYPFQQTIAQSNCLEHDAIESIDVGGPAMIRAAAKNFQDVAIVTCPQDYDWIASDLSKNNNHIEIDTRKALAAKAFQLCSLYDQAISAFLTPTTDTQEFPTNNNLH